MGTVLAAKAVFARGGGAGEGNQEAPLKPHAEPPHAWRLFRTAGFSSASTRPSKVFYYQRQNHVTGQPCSWLMTWVVAAAVASSHGLCVMSALARNETDRSKRPSISRTRKKRRPARLDSGHRADFYFWNKRRECPPQAPGGGLFHSASISCACGVRRRRRGVREK
jgi:hypothetical protein